MIYKLAEKIGDGSGDATPTLVPHFDVLSNDGRFKLRLDMVHFNENKSINVGLRFLWTAEEVNKKLAMDYEKKMEKSDIKEAREQYEERINSVQERINMASRIKKRPFDELREEERFTVYRKLIEMLIPVKSGTTVHITSENVYTAAFLKLIECSISFPQNGGSQRVGDHPKKTS